jgi:hypothetical protein
LSNRGIQQKEELVMHLRSRVLIAVAVLVLSSVINSGTSAQDNTSQRDRDRVRLQDQDQVCDGTQIQDGDRDQDRTNQGDADLGRKRIRTKVEDTEALVLKEAVANTLEPVKWPGYRLPDLRIGRWWYKPAARVGQEVELFFEIQNVGRRAARGPILWEVTNHNWGFWNPVLNRMAVSYLRPSLGPGQTRIVHIGFRMTRRMHNLRLMVDPSDHLGPPDNPPFGQKAKLWGWLSLKNGHVWESNEKNNAKWVCIKIFPLKPAEITEIEIPVINPFPGVPTPVVIEMEKELAIPEAVQVGLPTSEVASLALTNVEPIIEPVEPGQVIAKFEFDPEKDEESVVLLAKLGENALLAEPIRFRVLATATGPDGEPIFAEVTVVLDPEMEPVADATGEPRPVEEVPFN